MPAFVDRAKSGFASFRQRHSWADHLVRMQQHYSEARGNHLAGAITYFGFLSLFPLIAIAFAALSYVVRYYPDAQRQVEDWLAQNLPGLTGPGGIDVQAIAANGAARVSAGLVGIVGLLYSGLGWLDALRQSLRQMWAISPKDMNIVLKKIVDVFVLILLGGTVLVTTAASGIATTLTTQVLEGLGLSTGGFAAFLLQVLTIVLTVLANMVVLIVIFSRLPGHKLPWRNVWTGALLGAVGIEILKRLASVLLSGTTSNPVYGSFAVIVGVLVWINFISRVVMYAAAWCVVGPVPTTEYEVARRGETLDSEAADAVEEARKDADDRETVPVGADHKTSAGQVGLTTTGLAGARDGGGGRDGQQPDGQRNGRAKGKQQKGQQDGQQGLTLPAFASVIALVVARAKARR